MFLRNFEPGLPTTSEAVLSQQLLEFSKPPESRDTSVPPEMWGHCWCKGTGPSRLGRKAGSCDGDPGSRGVTVQGMPSPVDSAGGRGARTGVPKWMGHRDCRCWLTFREQGPRSKGGSWEGWTGQGLRA